MLRVRDASQRTAALLLHQRAAERVGRRVDEERVHHEKVALLARRLDDLVLVLLDELLDVGLQGRVVEVEVEVVEEVR